MAAAKRSGAVGAGLMGRGIAQTMARAGHRVAPTDPVEAARAAARARIAAGFAAMGVAGAEAAGCPERNEVAPTLAPAARGTDLVDEAAPEKPEREQAILADIEAHAPAGCILAPNTPVIPTARVMARVQDKARAPGTRRWNPPHMIPPVEVIRTAATSEATMAATIAPPAAGEAPVPVEKDVPGLIGNRLRHAPWREAMSLVERGICDATAVDTVGEAGFRAAARGAWPARERRSGGHRPLARPPSEAARRSRGPHRPGADAASDGGRRAGGDQGGWG